MDVAKLAGVSHQTVSRVINAHSSVRPITRERVQEAIRALEYQPSMVAQSLASQRSTALGVISVGTPHFGPSQMLSRIETIARDRGYTVGVIDVSTSDATSPDAATLEGAIQLMRRQQIAGLAVLAPVDFDTAPLEVLARNVPVVLVDAESTTRLPFTTIDQFEGGCLAARHLLDLGHTRFLVLAGPSQWHDAQLRLKGWLTVLHEVGLMPVAQAVGDWTAVSGYQATKHLLAQGHTAPTNFTAILAANDSMALGALRALHEHGLRVPEDVSVVGFDDTPDAEFFEPPLTTVQQNFDTLGRKCVEQLITLIETPELARRVQVITPMLVTRLSTGPGPIGRGEMSTTMPSTASLNPHTAIVKHTIFDPTAPETSR